ncbi:MAG: T9SS C-terminal target domain-containing protein, partial [Ignavibacteriales bacterium]
LNRINTYTGTAYKDETTIFSFELINEASNELNNSGILYNWYKEMAAFFKSIDANHLLTTGEMGEDDDRSQYSDINLFYNSSDFLFNGYKGTSYSKNLTVPGIDYGSFHLYAEGWGIHPAAGINWIKEHLFIAETLNKPSLLSEFGSRDNKHTAYKDWLEEVSTMNCRSAIIWQYQHPDIVNSDNYGFNLNDTVLIDIFRNFIREINAPLKKPEMPINAELFQNYPNPFNPVTTIKYALNSDDEIIVELFSSIGERIGVLDEGFKKRGTYELILSFDSERYSSGVYFYSLTTSRGKVTKKLMLLK